MTAKTRQRRAVVTRGEEDPPDKILAKHIVEIQQAMRKLMGGPLRERTIVLLIHDALPKPAKVGKRDIALVLNAIENLAHTFVKEGSRSA